MDHAKRKLARCYLYNYNYYNKNVIYTTAMIQIFFKKKNDYNAFWHFKMLFSHEIDCRSCKEKIRQYYLYDYNYYKHNVIITHQITCWEES